MNPRLKSILFCLLAAGAVAVAFLLDDAVIAFVNAHSTPASQAAGRIVSHYGEWQWLMLPCLVIAGIAFFQRKTEWVRIIAVMVIASAIAGLGNDVVRGITGRTRPNAPASIAQGWYGPRHMLDTNYNAFPSGHAAASMGLIAPLVFLRRRIGWALMPVPVVIAASRVCIGAHHLSDVTVGALFGIAAAAWVNQKIAPRFLRGSLLEAKPPPV